MSNLVQSKTVQISPRVSIPASVSRQEAKQLISSLFGNPATAFANTDKIAAHDAFTMRCAALALAKGVYGDSSRLERIESYAATLPSYAKAKDGSIKGAIGRLIIAYRDAVAIGAAIFDKLPTAQNDIDLSLLASSPVFGALIAPPTVRTAIAKPKADQPKADQPKVDQPKADQPKVDQPKVETTESAASKAHKEAIDKNWFNRALNTCDRDGLFNPMNDAVAWNTCAASAKLLREKQIADAAEKAARNVETLVGMFSQLFADQPEQAERHLREMAELAGFTVRRATVKRVNPIKEEKAA